MTAYFDAHATWFKSMHIHLTQPLGVLQTMDASDMIEAREREIVDDITLAVEQPEFPAELRDRAHRILACYATTASTEMPVPGASNDYKSEVEWVEGLMEMVAQLHDVFHAHGRGVAGGDDPTLWRTQMLAQGAARREDLTREPE